MPKLSQFHGIIISMNFSDHPPPHFHVKHGEHQACVSIATGRISTGTLPDRAFRLVHEWWSLHQAELEANWARREAQLPLLLIDPL